MERKLRESQSSDGAFMSRVYVGDRNLPDWNGFTTAQVLRTLGGMKEPGDLRDVIRRALDFLLCCRSAGNQGAFGFWPKALRPSWIGDLPDDADDTAVMGLELLKRNRLDVKSMRSIVLKALIPHRLRRIHGIAPPWLIPGVFYTWLVKEDRPNIVDCCANANVIALMSYLGLCRTPGFREACLMIESGIEWAGDSWLRAKVMSPYYPDPVELLLAIENAVACGAPLEKSLTMLCRLKWIRQYKKDISYSDRAICGNAYGKIVWRSKILQYIRRLPRE